MPNVIRRQGPEEVDVIASESLDAMPSRAKWPITINFGNNLSRNTVSEQYRDLPLFLVLELGELEYHIFLIHPY